MTDIHAPSGIPTHNFSRRAAVDLRLRPRSHWDRYKFYLLLLNQVVHMVNIVLRSVKTFHNPFNSGNRHLKNKRNWFGFQQKNISEPEINKGVQTDSRFAAVNFAGFHIELRIHYTLSFAMGITDRTTDNLLKPNGHQPLEEMSLTVVHILTRYPVIYLLINYTEILQLNIFRKYIRKQNVNLRV